MSTYCSIGQHTRKAASAPILLIASQPSPSATGPGSGGILVLKLLLVVSSSLSMVVAEDDLEGELEGELYYYSGYMVKILKRSGPVI